jgi:hypothetical protein
MGSMIKLGSTSLDVSIGRIHILGDRCSAQVILQQRMYSRTISMDLKWPVIMSLLEYYSMIPLSVNNAWIEFWPQLPRTGGPHNQSSVTPAATAAVRKHPLGTSPHAPR